MRNRFRSFCYFLIIFVLGITLGGYLFHDSRPRSYITVTQCSDGSCLRANEIMGLVGSLAMNRTPSLIPFVVQETDKTLVMEYPNPGTTPHWVLIPKKDIKDAGDVSTGDEPYIADVYAIISQLIRDNHLVKYRVITNGPGFQSVGYIHFHLIAYN